MIRWDRGLAWYDSAFGTQRSRVQITPIPLIYEVMKIEFIFWEEYN